MISFKVHLLCNYTLILAYFPVFATFMEIFPLQPPQVSSPHTIGSLSLNQNVFQLGLTWHWNVFCLHLCTNLPYAYSSNEVPFYVNLWKSDCAQSSYENMKKLISYSSRTIGSKNKTIGNKLDINHIYSKPFEKRKGPQEMAHNDCCYFINWSLLLVWIAEWINIYSIWNTTYCRWNVDQIINGLIASHVTYREPFDK